MEDINNGDGSLQEGTLNTELTKLFPGSTIDIDTTTDTTGKKWYVTIDNGIPIEVEAGKSTPQVATLPTDAGTTPYYPSDKFTKVKDTDLTTGLVITDSVDENGNSTGNEYVWIEVPNKKLNSSATFGPDYAGNSVSGSTDYENIEKAMITYVKDGLLNGSEDTSTNSDAYKNSRMGWKDEWYDRYNATVTGITAGGDKYGEVKNITSSNYSTAKNYYGSSLYTNSELTTPAGDSFANGTTYYVKFTETLLGDTEGCGLSYTNYNTKKNAMLKSVYENGGFWIGRYEAGTTTARNSGDSASGITPLSKIDLYPINWVKCSEAQTIANNVLNKGSYNSSLMFGIQWDCVLKFLNKRGNVSVTDLTSDSSTWGNYSDSDNLFTVSHGKYAFLFPWNVKDLSSWITIESEYTKQAMAYPNVGFTVFSTGATTRNMRKNIYDLSGNMYEKTLEHATSNASNPCATRGGNFGISGSSTPASYRYSNDTSSSVHTVRFSCLYLLIETYYGGDYLKSQNLQEFFLHFSYVCSKIYYNKSISKGSFFPPSPK